HGEHIVIVERARLHRDHDVTLFGRGIGERRFVLQLLETAVLLQDDCSHCPLSIHDFPNRRLTCVEICSLAAPYTCREIAIEPLSLARRWMPWRAASNESVPAARGLVSRRTGAPVSSP